MSESPTYMAEMTVVEVTIEMPDGRVARGRARVEDDMKIHPDRIEWRAVRDAFESACALIGRMSGEPCDCGVYTEDGRDTGIHHSTTCAMFRPPERYPARHGFTPGKFSQECRVMLARYPCNYTRDQHDPDLPPEDIDVFGYRRHKDD